MAQTQFGQSLSSARSPITFPVGNNRIGAVPGEPTLNLGSVIESHRIDYFCDFNVYQLSQKGKEKS